MIIDFQHHYLPEELVRKIGGKPGEVVTVTKDGVPEVTLHDSLFRVADHLRDMDIAGIDTAVLSAAGPSEDLDYCRVINDRFAELMKAYPKRFVGLCHVPPLGGQAALDELNRGITVLGLKGAAIRSQMKGMALDSPQFYPFWKKTIALDVPVFVHVASIPKGYEALRAPYDLYRSLGRELDVMVTVTRLILSGVIEEFPDLKLVLSHMGGGISAVKERIEMRSVAELVKGGARISRPFGDYFGKLYFDLAGFHGGMNALRCALTTISPERLVFATDYPQNFKGDGPGMRKYIEDIKRLKLDKHAEEQIFGENAAALLKL